MRIFKIWGDRNVYSEEFLTDLRGLLTAKKATPATPQSKQAEAPQTTTITATEFNVSTLLPHSFFPKKNVFENKVLVLVIVFLYLRLNYWTCLSFLL